MAHPLTSKKKAQALSTAFFLLGLATLIFTDDWWPGIMLVVGLPLALRQFMLGAPTICTSPFSSLSAHSSPCSSISPGGSSSPLFSPSERSTSFLREFFGPEDMTEEEKEEEHEKEIEEK